MALNILSKVVTNKVEKLFKIDESEKVPTEKLLKEEENRKLAQKKAEDERRKKHIKEEY